MVALFANIDVSPPLPRESADRNQTKAEDDFKSRKKERHELEAARRSSLIDEEARQFRVIKVAARVSISRVEES